MTNRYRHYYECQFCGKYVEIDTELTGFEMAKRMSERHRPAIMHQCDDKHTGVAFYIGTIMERELTKD